MARTRLVEALPLAGSLGLSQKSWGGWRLCRGVVGPACEGSEELVHVQFG